MILNLKEYEEYCRFMNIDNEEQEFLNYLKREDVQARLASIDEELGTSYITTINDFLSKQTYYIIPTDAVEWGETIPHPKDKTCDILINVRNCPEETLEHELRHAFENSNVFNKYFTGQYPFGYEIAVKESPRLKKLVEDNIRSWKEYLEHCREVGMLEDDKKLLEKYNYLSDPDEISAHLSLLRRSRVKNGNLHLFNYKNSKELDEDMLMIEDCGLNYIYEHIIKDKNKFAQVISKYAFITFPVLSLISIYKQIL